MFDELAFIYNVFLPYMKLIALDVCVFQSKPKDHKLDHTANVMISYMITMRQKH